MLSSISNLKEKLSKNTPIEDKVWSINHERIVVDQEKIQDFRIEPILMLATLFGNPFHADLKITGTENNFTLEIFQKRNSVGQFKLYQDPQSGGRYIYPQVTKKFRNLNFGTLGYLLANRCTVLLWGKSLSSNPRQLSPDAQNVWESLVSKKMAVKLGHNNYQMLAEVGESAEIAQLLRNIMKLTRIDLQDCDFYQKPETKVAVLRELKVPSSKWVKRIAPY